MLKLIKLFCSETYMDNYKEMQIWEKFKEPCNLYVTYERK
jgi:hypothetical protein